MSTKAPKGEANVTRREFLGVGGAVLVGSTLPFRVSAAGRADKQEKTAAKIMQYRTLGRTGFKVSDISMGTTRNRDANVVRAAYDSGINYFDTAESYVGGEAEKLIGGTLKFMDRKKVFITSKIHVEEGETEEAVLDRFRKCQERLNTDYIDAFYLHGVSDLATLDHAGFHAAATKLKAEGRLKHIGVSSHGARWGRKSASMEDVLCAAAEDGRFDLMLLIYNFMNKEAGDKVLAACKKKNVGTTAMKTAPGVLKAAPFDAENPTEDQKRMIDRMKKRGMSEERIAERMERFAKRQEESQAETEPFAKRHNIETEDELYTASIRWVLENPDMHAVCISFSDIEKVEKIVSISGTKLSSVDRRFLEEYRDAYSNQYCRHGCAACTARCSKSVPVSTIMRYAYYFECQHREKDAMKKYARLAGRDALNCVACDAPCSRSCPHGIDVQAQLLQAHSLLTLA